MAIYVNSNIASIDAQRNLAHTQLALQGNISHLSSGMRINNAADDAAGLAVSEQFRAQVKSFDQASRNANDGISMVQTADGALNQFSGILQRARQLAVQSANGTLSTTDRSYINNEFTALKSEIDRISNVTTFNGNNLLDGSVRSVNLQVGTGTTAGVDTVAVNLFGANTATGSVQATKAAALSADTTLSFNVGGGTVAMSFTAANDTMQTVVDAINKNAVLQTYGVQAGFKDAGGGNFQLQLTGSASFTGFTDSGTALDAGTEVAAFDATTGLASAKTTALGYDAGSNTHLSDATLDNPTNAVAALKNIDQAINDVSSIRATLGVSQNRLQFAIDNLASSSQNYQAADSRIRDVDVASETAAMTRNQILSQAGVSVLAQANQLPQSALSLLQGH